MRWVSACAADSSSATSAVRSASAIRGGSLHALGRDADLFADARRAAWVISPWGAALLLERALDDGLDVFVSVAVRVALSHEAYPFVASGRGREPLCFATKA